MPALEAPAREDRSPGALLLSDLAYEGINGEAHPLVQYIEDCLDDLPAADTALVLDVLRALPRRAGLGGRAAGDRVAA